uniref:Deleted in malignant brain tumors 1 protein n=1 Tax=Magallana gigas TaxID=29159 RepID=K1QIU3_MAGGI
MAGFGYFPQSAFYPVQTTMQSYAPTYDFATALKIQSSNNSNQAFQDAPKLESLPKCDCGKEISGKLHGKILSPNFPLTYPTDTLCTWKITVPEGYAVSLDFKVVEIERDYDMLYIYDTTTGDHIGRLTGHQNGYQLNSTSNKVTIFFSSDQYRGGPGFKIIFKAINLHPVVCGGTFNGKTSGEIVSPNFPNNYPLGITCTWKIVVAEGSVVKLYFQTVETEKTYDTITITDSYTNEFIDNKKGYTVTSTGNRVTVLFTADENDSEQGFKLLFSTITPPTPPTTVIPPVVCGGKITGKDKGRIMSPLYPKSYPIDVACTWELTVSEGKLIRVYSTFMSTEAGSDIITFLDPLSGSYITSVSGDKSDFSTVSIDNTLTIVFLSDAEITGDGFILNFEAFTPPTEPPTTLEDVCGGEITGQSRGNIHSPRFPSEYPLDINCTWVITVPEGKYMRLAFPILRTEENHDLIVLKTDDYLDEVSGHEDGLVLLPESNKVTIFFTSDSERPDTGFNMTFEAVEIKQADCFGSTTLPNPMNNMKFTTLDQDNDLRSGANCAIRTNAGWWHTSCANPNGLYLRGENSLGNQGVTYGPLRGVFNSMKPTQMMVRRVRMAEWFEPLQLNATGPFLKKA